MKLNRLIKVTALFVLTPLSSHAEGWENAVEIDFSEGHSIELLLQSDAEFIEDTEATSDRKIFTMTRQDLRIRLPGGRLVQQKIISGSVTAQDGSLESLATTGPILPLEEAYQVAKDAHSVFEIPTDRLEQWMHNARDPGLRVRSFGNVAPDHYPALHLQIHPSMNPKYPWFVRLSIGWNSPRHEGWDEARANAENPRPPEGSETLSLDSPSGRIYDAGEAFEHLNQAQEKLDQELGQGRNEHGDLIFVKPGRENAKDSSISVAPKQADEKTSVPFVVGVMVVLFSLAGVLYLKNVTKEHAIRKK